MGKGWKLAFAGTLLYDATAVLIDIRPHGWRLCFSLPGHCDVEAALNTLRTGRLTLEPQIAGHAAEMFIVLNDPAIYEFENAPPESQAWLEKRYEKLESRRSADGTEYWLNWVVRLPSNELAGYVQATVEADSIASVAYEFASKYWRQGIGSASVGAMLNELTTNYRVHTFVAVLKASNFRSEAFLHSMDFTANSPPGLRTIARESDELVMYKPGVLPPPLV